MYNLKTMQRNSDDSFVVEDLETEKYICIQEMFNAEYWDAETFKFAKIRGYEPMTAKELETEEDQLKELNSPENIIEEKFDGVRGLLRIFSQKDIEGEDVSFARIFSRNISIKTKFYNEHSDRLPHLRDLFAPELNNTILDGEMFIDGKPFKEVSSILNCKWDEAIDRQIELGFITFHAFDILFYKGIDMRRLPLLKRKEFLSQAVEEINDPYVKEVPFFSVSMLDVIHTREFIVEKCGAYEDQFLTELEEDKNKYPELCKCLNTTLTPRAFYEAVVATGGEGVMVKSTKGRYLHKRGWEYSKIKKFITKDLIVTGYEPPTKEYTGNSLKNWNYWVDATTDERLQGVHYGDKNAVPVTKHYYENLIGNLVLGVVISDSEIQSLPKKKKFNITELDGMKILEVCTCSGFDEEVRAYVTRNKKRLIGSVVEVKSNELFKDTGRMRHPRFFRFRKDKCAKECLWSAHINR